VIFIGDNIIKESQQSSEPFTNKCINSVFLIKLGISIINIENESNFYFFPTLICGPKLHLIQVKLHQAFGENIIACSIANLNKNGKQKQSCKCNLI
jgi:hypothetical protein